MQNLILLIIIIGSIIIGLAIGIRMKNKKNNGQASNVPPNAADARGTAIPLWKKG